MKTIEILIFGSENGWSIEQDQQTHLDSVKLRMIVDSFAIQEKYQNAKSKYQGTSINKFNSGTDQWEQFWVDNTGLTLHLKGQKIENKMILQNTIGSGEGLTFKNRITWIDNGDGTVQQIWEQSQGEDGQWLKNFDGTYIKKGTVLPPSKKKKAKKPKKVKKQNN